MTQQSDAPPPQIVSASRPPLRVSGWALWRWSLLLLAAATTLAYEGHALLRLSFGVSAEHPAHEDGAAVRAGSRALALTVLLPWALACRVVRRRLRVIVAALVCAVPVIWFWRYVHAGCSRQAPIRAVDPRRRQAQVQGQRQHAGPCAVAVGGLWSTARAR